MAAIEAKVDVPAHPGFINEEEVALATKNNLMLELSGRRGHSLTNGHVAKLSLEAGALLGVNADAHSPGDFLTKEMAEKVALGSGLSKERYKQLRKDMQQLVSAL